MRGDAQRHGTAGTQDAEGAEDPARDSVTARTGRRITAFLLALSQRDCGLALLQDDRNVVTRRLGQPVVQCLRRHSLSGGGDPNA